MTKFVFLPPYNAYTKELRDQFAKQISDSSYILLLNLLNYGFDQNHLTASRVDWNCCRNVNIQASSDRIIMR